MINIDELNKFIRSLDNALMLDIEDINNFSHSDIIYLEKSMLLHLRSLKKYDAKTLKISKKIAEMYKYKDVLANRLSIKENDIIDNMLPQVSFKMLLNTTIALTLSSDAYDFIKKISLLIAIDYIAFKLSMLHTTSDRMKEIVKRKIIALELSIQEAELYYALYQKISHCFSQKLDTEYNKLLELYPEIDESELKIKTKRRK